MPWAVTWLELSESCADWKRSISHLFHIFPKERERWNERNSTFARRPANLRECRGESPHQSRAASLNGNNALSGRAPLYALQRNTYVRMAAE